MLIHQISRVLAFSTTTPLAANEVYTSPTIDAINYKVLGTLVASDVAGTYFLQASDDGITWHNTSTSASNIAANSVFTTNNNVYSRYMRLVYTNGAAAQTAFKISAYLSPL